MSKKTDKTLPTEPVPEYEQPATESDSADADQAPRRAKKDRVWSNHQMRTVRVGDRVKAEGERIFTVAGIRLNPMDMPHSARIRLFDDAGVIRLEADPTYMVECER